MKKIYLAGPDVFEKDALAQGEALKKLCNDFGFEGLFPLDNIIKEDDPVIMAEAIFRPHPSSRHHHGEPQPV